MRETTQISAFVSRTTRERLERYTAAHGLKKAAVVEAALLHHLQALEELPVDLIVPARVTLDSASFARVAERVASPRPPTGAMRALLAGDSVEGLDD